VTVKVFNDAKAATLGLLTVDAHVVDAADQKYTRDMDAETRSDRSPSSIKRSHRSRASRRISSSTCPRT
jgi:hypothetical protein